ncbi:hypothetical protein N312_11882, partial [Balearica regulorum gibbericeps]
ALNLQKPVNCNDQSDIFGRQANGTQYNHHCDKSGLGDTCSPDAGCSSCDAKSQIKPRNSIQNT